MKQQNCIHFNFCVKSFATFQCERMRVVEKVKGLKAQMQPSRDLNSQPELHDMDTISMMHLYCCTSLTYCSIAHNIIKPTDDA